MDDTECYESLHRLSIAQSKAVSVLTTGGTQAEAAEAAGVHRVTVARWVTNHPGFIAEMNRIKVDVQRKTLVAVDRVTDKALQAVETSLEDGNVEAALRWLKLISPKLVSQIPDVPTDSEDVIDDARKEMPAPILRILMESEQTTTAEAEEEIRSRLRGPL